MDLPELYNNGGLKAWPLPMAPGRSPGVFARN